MTFFRIILGVIAVLALPASALADSSSGWRPATNEEKAMRKTFEDAWDDWNPRRDGEAEMYDCLYNWAIWGKVSRDAGDEVPTISGELSHSFADAQMSHFLSVLAQGEKNGFDSFRQKLGAAAQRFSAAGDFSTKDVMARLGKCYVSPTSWKIHPDLRYQAPKFLADMTGQQVHSGYPSFVKSTDARDRFDALIMAKDFPGAANFGASLHGNNDKTTVMWNEVLAASRLSVEQGRGTDLDNNLLQVLSRVWWPKWRKDQAAYLYRRKNGIPEPQRNSRPEYKQPEIPYYIQQEQKRYLDGQTNYIPCNRWYQNTGC